MRKNLISKETAQIIAKFSTLKGAKFIGVKEYTSKTSGEVANYVVNVNFSYGNAVKKDIETLQTATEKDLKDIAINSGIDINTVRDAHAKVLESLQNNQNEETKSNQSKAQTEAFEPITNGIKLHTETKQFYIYAMAVNKTVLQKGEYKKVNSRPLTLAKKAVQKHFDLKTIKYRQFIIAPEQLKQVNVSNETFSMVD